MKYCSLHFYSKMVIILDYYVDRDDIYEFSILIQYEEDLKSISKVISKGDIICFKKENIWKERVENVNYIENTEKKILIEVRMKDNSFKNFYIYVSDEFKMYKTNSYEVERIYKIINYSDKYDIYRKSISGDFIKEESFRILKEYMNKKKDKVIYGQEVISYIEKEKVKVVFVNWTFLILRQEEKWFLILTNEENKYKNVNVVGKGDENYNEIKSYGGIIGVLN